MDMFYKYECNNILHNLIEKIIKYTLESDNPGLLNSVKYKFKFLAFCLVLVY